MIGYAQKEVFSESDFVAYRWARLVVNQIPDHIVPAQAEWRCHEVAAVVGRVLNARGIDAELQDGQCGIVEHSWLWLPPHPRLVILDPYVPGRHPQVHLVHVYPGMELYKRGQKRPDVDWGLVERLVASISLS